LNAEKLERRKIETPKNSRNYQNNKHFKNLQNITTSHRKKWWKNIQV